MVTGPTPVLVRRVQLPEVVKPPARVVGVELGEMAALPACPVQVTVPEALTVGLPFTVSVVVRLPDAVGEQVVVTVQLWPGANVVQALRLTVMAATDEVPAEIVTDTGPLLVRVWLAVVEVPTWVSGWLVVVSCRLGPCTVTEACAGVIATVPSGAVRRV